MNEPGLTHLSISVDDVRATAERAVHYGGAIIEESDVGCALFVRDPDGQLLELLPVAYRKRLTPQAFAVTSAAGRRPPAGDPGRAAPGWLRWWPLGTAPVGDTPAACPP